MPSSYTPLLRLTLPADGELVGTWGQTVNNGITTLEEAAIAGTVAVAMADANQTLSTANGATDQARYNTISLTGALTAQRNVVCPAVSKNYFVRNATTGGFGINFKTSAGTGVVVPAGEAMLLYCDGTGVVHAQSAYNATAISSTTNKLTLPPQVGITAVSPWGASWSTLDLGNLTAIGNESSGGSSHFAFNTYHDGSNWKAKANAKAFRMSLSQSGWSIDYAPAVAANATQSFANRLYGNLEGGLLELNYPTTSNSVGPNYIINNRGNNGVAEYRRLGGITFGGFRDVADPCYLAGIYGYNVSYPGTSGGIDFVVADDNSSNTSGLVAGNYRFRIAAGSMVATVPISLIGNVGGASSTSCFAYAPTNGGGNQTAFLAAGAAASTGQYIRAQRWTAADSEPTVYRLDMEINNTSTPGFPIFRYDWILGQYSGFTGNSCAVYGINGQWAFAVAIQNGPSDEVLKSNWTYTPLDFVDKLALLQGGTFDLTIPGTGSPAKPAFAGRPYDPETGMPAAPPQPALPATPPPTIRQIGISAQGLQTAMPDAVFTREDGYLAIRGGDAALVAAVALAKRIKAIEAFVGM